jgi:hypothetical protein
LVPSQRNRPILRTIFIRVALHLHTMMMQARAAEVVLSSVIF